MIQSSGAGKIEQIRGDWNGEYNRHAETGVKACSGVISHVHCPIRVSCMHYHAFQVTSTEFVKADDFVSAGHKDLGCNDYRWILPDDSQRRILTFDKAVKKYAE